MNMEENKKRNISALAPLTIILALVSGIFIGVKLNNFDNNVDRRLMFFMPQGKINQAIEFIKNSYVDGISANTLEEDAIRGVLKNLDPHSQYIPASDFLRINEPIEGNFSGIGVQFNMLSDTVVIINTIVDGPSEKAGINAGDRIVKVNDLTIAGVRMSNNDIMDLLKGVTGTKVKVGIHRRGVDEILDFEITRDRIPLFSIDVAYMITPEIGYIKVNKFSRTTFNEFVEAAETLRAEGMTKMIIDLRDNPGGIIEGAIRMSELFLPAGKLIVYTDGNKRGRTNYFSNGRNTIYGNTELVLLIDERSASASEIVAGAIQDNDRGTIIGRRSYGKGLVQEQYRLADGSALRVTIARYYTPTGRCIQKPYSNDRDEYFNELNERNLHGELSEADSIRFNDSLRFVTPAGKVVYGGGGIMPDIFVPMNTSEHYSGFLRTVNQRNLMLRFALEFSPRHRSDLLGITDYKSMQTHLRSKKILNEFVAYAAKQGVNASETDLRTSGPLIENIVMAFIGRTILNDDGYFPILNEMDDIVQKGVEQLTIK